MKILQSTSLTNLHSLIIIPCDTIDDQLKFYQSIFRLSVLKYCKLSFQSAQNFLPISISTNELSSIEHLIIDHYSNIDEFTAVLSYLPHLHRLSGNNSYRLRDIIKNRTNCIKTFNTCISRVTIYRL